MKILLLASIVALPMLHLQNAKESAVPPWKLTATRDSFVMRVNGQNMGYTVLAVEKLPTGFRVTENTRIGAMVEQTTEILLDLEQRMVSVLQSGKARGQEMRIELRYGKSRVKGSATVPGPAGMTSHNVDTEVPTDVVDDNLLQSVIPMLPWSDVAAFSVPVFSAGKNKLLDMQLTVAGTEQVTLPGGNVEAYKVELRGSEVPMNFFVSKAEPHRIVKYGPAGVPVEFLLAN